MLKIQLLAKKRETVGKKVKTIRSGGSIPAILYGQGFKPVSLELKRNDFIKAFSKAGMNNLVDLAIDKEAPAKILIHDVQTHPVTDELIHADLYKVRKDRKLRTQIPLHFFGKSKAVKDKEGNLITHKDAIEVEVLPDDLIEEIDVDITSLKTFDDVIKISDLDIPANIEVLDDKDDIVANVTPPRSEEELEALEEEVEEDVEAVEVEKEKGVEGEEAAEGEEGAPAEAEAPPAEETPAGAEPQSAEPPSAPQAEQPEKK